MKQSTETYTRRENARRAGVAAGVPAERVAVTVHKNGDEVRFGWKESATPVKQPKMATNKPPKVQPEPREERNGVKRPRAGGVCAEVWAWLDANPGVTVKDAKAAATGHGWNENNASIEFYAWRKFNGIKGRVTAAAK